MLRKKNLVTITLPNGMVVENCTHEQAMTYIAMFPVNSNQKNAPEDVEKEVRNNDGFKFNKRHDKLMEKLINGGEVTSTDETFVEHLKNNFAQYHIGVEDLGNGKYKLGKNLSAPKNAPNDDETKDFDWDKYEPKKDDDGYYNRFSWEYMRKKYIQDTTGINLLNKKKKIQWIPTDKFAEYAHDFVNHFPYVKKEDRQ